MGVHAHKAPNRDRRAGEGDRPVEGGGRSGGAHLRYERVPSRALPEAEDGAARRGKTLGNLRRFKGFEGITACQGFKRHKARSIALSSRTTRSSPWPPVPPTSHPLHTSINN